MHDNPLVPASFLPEIPLQGTEGHNDRAATPMQNQGVDYVNMKRLPAFSLLAASLTLPIYAQRSISHGGFSGHSPPPARGGFSASSTQRFTGASPYIRSMPLSMSPSLRRNGPTNYMARPASPYRRPYLSPYRARTRFAVPIGTGWAGPGFLGYPDTAGYDDSATPPSYGEPYGSQPPDEGLPTPYNPYQAWFELSYPSLTPEKEDAITLLFKDGRPPEQIHNYLLTRTTLYVRDQQRRDIALDQLDLAATQKVNHDAGVDFQLPLTSK
jgi:hypothetical protein